MLDITTQNVLGASKEDWNKFSNQLELTSDLLPTICNTNTKISPMSKMRKVGKTPSIYNRHREAIGLSGWTDKHSTMDEIVEWSGEKDYGICVQTRHLRAIDIDVPDKDKAQEIQKFIENFTDKETPIRYRKNSGKCLLAFYIEGNFPKKIVKVDDGIIEFLANGQQFVAAGTHESGVPYEWDWKGQDNFPTLTFEQSNRLWEAICKKFGIAESVILSDKQRNSWQNSIVTRDETIEKLEAKNLVLSYGSEDQAFIECPFKDGHSEGTGNESSTAYFPRGGRGYQQGHFKCLHASCASRTDGDFIDALNLISDRFDVIEKDDDEAVMPILERNKKTGKIKPTINNIIACINRPDIIHFEVPFDEFSCDLMIRSFGSNNKWRNFEEIDFTIIQTILESGHAGFEPISFETLKRGIKRSAHLNKIDNAKILINSLPKWDGIARVENFLPEYLRSEKNDYTRAVSRYIWTALAGRALHPGIKADMIPILCGKQGIRKSTAIELLSPLPEFFMKMSFSEKDDDISRKLRGKLVVEIDELRGLNSRDADYIKSFISRTHERWVKKYEERTTGYGRRCIFFGSTNEEEFLVDPTGNRRWLPFKCGIDGIINTDKIVKDREQLWAEGLELFLTDGIDWSAEVLAPLEHKKFEINSPYEDIIADWLETPDEFNNGKRPKDWDFITTKDVLTGAVMLPQFRSLRNMEMEVAKALKSLGYNKLIERVGNKSQRLWRKLSI